MCGTIPGTIAITSNALLENNKLCNILSKVSSYTTDIQGYNSIILSQGSYSIELQGGKSGSYGYTGPYQEIYYCNGDPGQSGETSTFDSVNEYYSATSDNVKNFTINLDKQEIISFYIGKGGVGGSSTGNTGACPDGENGKNGSILITSK